MRRCSITFFCLCGVAHLLQSVLSGFEVLSLFLVLRLDIDERKIAATKLGHIEDLSVIVFERTSLDIFFCFEDCFIGFTCLLVNVKAFACFVCSSSQIISSQSIFTSAVLSYYLLQIHVLLLSTVVA